MAKEWPSAAWSMDGPVFGSCLSEKKHKSPHKRCKHMGLSENMVPTRLIDDLDNCYTLVVSRIFGQTHPFPPDTTGKHCHPRTDQALSSSGCMPQCQALPLTSSKRVPSQVNTKVTNKSLLPKLWPVLFQHGWCQFYHLGLVNSIWGLQDSHVSAFLSQARLADPVPKPSPKRQLNATAATASAPPHGWIESLGFRTRLKALPDKGGNEEMNGSKPPQ